MAEELIFRPPTSRDLDAFVEMTRDFYVLEDEAFRLDAVTAAFERLVAGDPVGRCWFFEVDGEIAGRAIISLFFSVAGGGVAAYIDEIYIKAQFRGLGYGAHVLAHIEREVSEEGVSEVSLAVRRNNRHARHVYQKAGFKRGEYELMWKDIGAPVDGLVRGATTPV